MNITYNRALKLLKRVEAEEEVVRCKFTRVRASPLINLTTSESLEPEHRAGDK